MWSSQRVGSLIEYSKVRFLLCVIEYCPLSRFIDQSEGILQKNVLRKQNTTHHYQILMENNKSRLFGTDGIRGIANLEPMTPENAFRLGRAAGYLFFGKNRSQRPCFIIGKDTRHSGSMLEGALVAGLNSIGVDALLAGVIPTPAVALLTRHHHAQAGIVISASHNPAEDNGLKLFGGDGYKLDDEKELYLEELMFSLEARVPQRPIGADLGICSFLPNPLESYITAVLKSVPTLSLKGIRIAVDCAHGAASESTPRILEALGATLFLFHNTPNGLNINEGCGSTHGEELQRLTLESQAHLGIAHDGDADRLLLCDAEGNLVDGDEILAMTALDALKQKKLRHQTLVTTIMSNFGLDTCLEAAGGKVLRTPVGDRYVIEAMKREGFNIGGEQSGHLIFHDHSTTGDGIIAALQVLRLMTEKKQSLSLLRKCLIKYPQAQRHLRIKEKLAIDVLHEKIPLIEEVEKQLQGQGRLLLRYSGTEPLLRLLIEGRDAFFINQAADKIIQELATLIG
jgi:phosphoglucosamine mutase